MRPSHATSNSFEILTETLYGTETLDAWVASVEKNENATMLRDSMVKVAAYDEFANVLAVDVSTVGIDATMHVTRSVKNDVDRWQIGLPDTQKECSTAAGLTLCRTIVRTTNTFGEVDTEETSTSDNRNDSKLFVRYERDIFGNVTKVIADDAFGHHRETTTVFDKAGVFPTKHINAMGHEMVSEYDNALGVLRKETDPNGLTTEWSYDGLSRLTLEQRPDGSQTTIVRNSPSIVHHIPAIWCMRRLSGPRGAAAFVLPTRYPHALRQKVYVL